MASKAFKAPASDLKKSLISRSAITSKVFVKEIRCQHLKPKLKIKSKRKNACIGEGVLFLKFLQMSFILRDSVNIYSNIHGKNSFSGLS